LCIVDKFVLVEDEERTVAYGLLKEPGWFINPISDATYEYFLKFKGISILPAQFLELFTIKNKNFIIIFLELILYIIILLTYFIINFLARLIQVFSFFILKNILFLKFLYFLKFFIYQYFLKYNHSNPISYLKQIGYFCSNLIFC
jgi:hypothetical protein